MASEKKLHDELESLRFTPPRLSLSRLDDMVGFVLESEGIGGFSGFVRLLKFAAMIGYIIARHFMIRGMLHDTKQELALLLRRRAQRDVDVI